MKDDPEKNFPVSVLFVCLGNICRSPAAEQILRQKGEDKKLTSRLHIESCGLGTWHKGSLPDRRMREAAFKRGYGLISRAQMFSPSHFENFDYIFAADHSVYHELNKYAHKPEHRAKIHLTTAYSTLFKNQEIPDPYYNGEAAFEGVLDMLEEACEGIVNHIVSEHFR